MRVTICELQNTVEGLRVDLPALRQHARAEQSDLVLLPEMPFDAWLPANKTVSAHRWRAAMAAHDSGLQSLSDLEVPIVGTRPAARDGIEVNQGFVQKSGNCAAVHEKYYLPDEEGFWEASWYSRGDDSFDVFPVAGALAGMLICTELWFFERARAYGQSGAHTILNPRATEQATVDRWIVAGRAAAISAGAWCLSSNLVTHEEAAQPMGGTGWVISPDGDVLATTARSQPFITIDIETQAADAAKRTYPRYVRE